MRKDVVSLMSGDLLEDDIELTLAELCRSCQVPAEWIFELVDEGLVEPLGRDPARWRFQGLSIRRVRCALRLQRDLGVNVAGAALALDLLEELQMLRERLQRLDVR